MDIALLHRRGGLSFRAIGRRVGCTPRTAKKYPQNPELAGEPRRPGKPRPSKLDAFRDQIAFYLHEDPGYRASRIYEHLRRQGYPGGYELVKRAVRPIRMEQRKRAYIRFETEPGVQGQVDSAELQAQGSDGRVKTYYVFALLLGYSRMLYAELLERCDMVSFLEAHQRAFAALGGAPMEILYDRMRNVFARQVAGKPEFTQPLMKLAAHYGFSPRVAPAYAPWVKGKVERPFDYLRESFWRGYEFRDIASANRDLCAWLRQTATRVHGTTRERVDVRFQREGPLLSPLPPAPCDVSEQLYRQVRKDCQISVHGNRYVVEHTLVGRQVLVRVRHRQLRVYDDARLVVTYEMPEGKGHLVEDKRFYAALRADTEMQLRKFARGRRHKARATVSPSTPRCPIEVQRRPIADYALYCEEVRHG